MKWDSWFTVILTLFFIAVAVMGFIWMARHIWASDLPTWVKIWMIAH